MKKSSKSPKIEIFHGFCPNLAIFQSKGNVFNDILDRKNAFLGYKNKKFKRRKIEFFF